MFSNVSVYNHEGINHVAAVEGWGEVVITYSKEVAEEIAKKYGFSAIYLPIFNSVKEFKHAVINEHLADLPSDSSQSDTDTLIDLDKEY